MRYTVSRATNRKQVNMADARYKKGNKYHLVEHLFNNEPNGVVEIFDTEKEALRRVEEINETAKRISESQRAFNQI